MKLSLFILLAFSFPILAEKVQEASTKEATRLYPSLLIADSPLNKKFLKAVAKAKAENDPILQQPNWILTIANRVGGESDEKTISFEPTPIPTPKPVTFIPSSTTLGGPAGSALGTNRAPDTYAIGGIISQKTGDGLLVKLNLRGSGHKVPKQSLVYLQGHPDYKKLIDGDKIKCIATLGDPYDYVTVLGAPKTVQGYQYAGNLH